MQIAQTLHYDQFQMLVTATMTERRQRLLTKRGLFISTAPEIAEAIERSKLFSRKFIAALLLDWHQWHVANKYAVIERKGRAYAMIGRRRKLLDQKPDEDMVDGKEEQIMELTEENATMAKQMAEMQKLLTSLQKPRP